MSKLQMRESKGILVNDEGKSIPYTKESYQVSSDEMSNYWIEIIKWSKNTTI
jgi:hypothetical protein